MDLALGASLVGGGGEFSYTKDTCMNLKHNWSEICMRFHTNDKTIIADNYENALDIIKQKLYSGDYYTSTDSSINMAYNRTSHRSSGFS
ncbi:MAG TPA: hypothetical protein VE971_02590 [Candidatus Eisenbacteria bacterium]|nr:hypothetical protein [Candidatus Eisenbacteria bacterium]